MATNLDALINNLDALTVPETNDLVQKLESKWHVKAETSQPGIVPTVFPVEVAEAQTTFNVFLRESGASKINVIKEVRTMIVGLGIKEAKDLVDAAPILLKEGVAKEEAEAMKQKLEAAGAKVELK